MAVIKLKKDEKAKHFGLKAVQDVKVNGMSVFDGEEANIILKNINGKTITGTGDLLLEIPNNKVTTIDENSTDEEYPSAKCVYDIIGDIESLLQEV